MPFPTIHPIVESLSNLFTCTWTGLLLILNTLDALLMEQACAELRNSVRLRKLLGIILFLGNRLNLAGMEDKVPAAGLTLDSLSKLDQVKAFDEAKTTFLQYMVKIVGRNKPDLLSFKDDLASVLKAERLSWDREQLCLINGRIERVRSLALRHARQTASNSNRHVLNEDVLLLRTTRVGMFVVNAEKTLSQIQEKANELDAQFEDLMVYFSATSMQPNDLFRTIAAFVRSVDKARNDNRVCQGHKVHTKRDSSARNKIDDSRTSSSSNRVGPKLDQLLRESGICSH